MQEIFRKILNVLCLLAFLAVISLLPNTFQLSASDTLVDYNLYNHQIAIDALRAGNHDDSGIDEYYFKVKLSALNNGPDEIKKEIKERGKISKDEPAEFGAVSVNVLTTVPAETLAGPTMVYEIKGDAIRLLVSDAMRQFKLSEGEIAVMVEIEMFERGKKYVFFGEDTLIGHTEYFPIPPNKYQVGGRVNLKLSLTDDKGTDVRFKIKYESLEASPTPGPNPPSKPPTKNEPPSDEKASQSK